MRPVVHYMMGGVHTDIDGATPLAGPVRRGRGRLRQHQRRQPAGLQLAARVPRLRRPRRTRGRRVRRAPPARRPAGDRGPGRRRGTPARAGPAGRGAAAPTRVAAIRDRDAADDGGRRRDLPRRAEPGQGRRRPARSCRSGCATVGDRRHQPDLQHRAGRRPRAGHHARRRRVHARVRRCSARSRAARTSAPTSPPATTSGSWPTRWSTATPTARRGWSTCR